MRSLTHLVLALLSCLNALLLGCWLTCKQEQVDLIELERETALGRCMSAHKVRLCKLNQLLVRLCVALNVSLRIY